jgi:hypothetical protein
MTIGNFIDPTTWSNIQSLMTDAIDDMIQNFGKDCILIFPGSKQISCINCVQDSWTKRGMNVYLSGGPVPFGQNQSCPVCGGKGLMQSLPKTQTVHMVLNWSPSDFNMLPTNIESSYSMVETEGWMKDLPAILQARVMIAEVPLIPIIKARFELSGEPIDPHGIKQGYCFTARWKRKG